MRSLGRIRRRGRRRRRRATASASVVRTEGHRRTLAGHRARRRDRSRADRGRRPRRELDRGRAGSQRPRPMAGRRRLRPEPSCSPNSKYPSAAVDARVRCRPGTGFDHDPEPRAGRPAPGLDDRGASTRSCRTNTRSAVLGGVDQLLDSGVGTVVTTLGARGVRIDTPRRGPRPKRRFRSCRSTRPEPVMHSAATSRHDSRPATTCRRGPMGQRRGRTGDHRRRRRAIAPPPRGRSGRCSTRA